jgi:cyclic-di-GMP phosphodiesterase TipF (flagellum assembly factor)
MVRISAIFIAACMVLIAGSLGFVVYLRFGFTGAESALVGLGTLTALAVYNAIAARKHDRLEASNQLSNLARGSGDLARQLAEFGRRLSAIEAKTGTVIDRALATAQPLASEIEELSTLVKQLADSVAAHEVALHESVRIDDRGSDHRPSVVSAEPVPAPGTMAAATSQGPARHPLDQTQRRRLPRRPRSPASPVSTATASLRRSRAPSTAQGSNSTCNRS